MLGGSTAGKEPFFGKGIRIMRKTKIICTLGPASDTEEIIRELMLSGMDVARINFSHGDYEGHKHKADIVKKLREELNLHTALLLDTKGPEIRLKKFRNGKVELIPGQSFILYEDDREGDENGVSITYTGLYGDVHPGSRLLIDDGLIELKVEYTDPKEIRCTVVNGGVISDRKSINVPGASLSLPFLSEKDKEDIAFGVREGFDFIAASFTQRAEDIRQIRAELNRLGSPDIRIIAKIENAKGVENMDEILNEADGLMVARGDLGVEVPMESIPFYQKQMISKAYLAGKQVITATQMLESMTKNPRPTRAEVNDVANAIYDGTSAIMLSGETASGLYPIEAVKTMARVALRTESDIDYKEKFRGFRLTDGANSVVNAISHASVTTAHDLKASAIIAATKSGQTVRLISRYRPAIDIIGCSPSPRVCRQMNMSWGVRPLLMGDYNSTDKLVAASVDLTYRAGFVNYGDLVVITAGIPEVSGTTNMLRVQLVGDILVTGKGVSGGKVFGTLRVCRDEDEALKTYKAGEVLVLPHASDRIISLIRSCKGIVCEEGDAESYAAVAGQALDIPVIVGAGGATKLLHTGTSVTVDGTRGMVYISQTEDGILTK